MLEFCSNYVVSCRSYAATLAFARAVHRGGCCVDAIQVYLLAQYLDLLGLEDLLFVANLHHLLLLLLQRVRHTTLRRRPKESPCRDATDLAEDWQ
jgi:hypothetical protein